jgi:protein TonB
LDTPPPEPKITPPKPPAKKKEEPKVVKKVSKRQKVTQSLLDKEMEEIFRQTPTDEDVKEVKKPSKKLVEITGLLSKRGIRRSYLPTYPEWAQQKGIEAEVMIHFTVSPSGHVLDAHIKLTSGYGELDRLAMKALKRWVFEPLPPEVKKINQWGLIVFRFLLQ